MTDNDDVRYVCYSNRDDWVRTNKVGKYSISLPAFKGGPDYLTDTLYECSICHAEFPWRKGLGHKVPCGTLSLFSE